MVLDVEINESELLAKAWEARQHSFAWKSKTQVGCAIQTTHNRILLGWNIEGLWMGSIHAEVCALSKMYLRGERICKIAIVAEVEFFTPCGSCRDWLFQFCEIDSIVIIQNKNREISRFGLNELCPFYPKQ